MTLERAGRVMVLALMLVSPAWAGVTDAPAAPASMPEVVAPESAKEPQGPKGTYDDTTVAQARTSFEVLSERLIGVASRSVRYDWRRQLLGVAIVGSQLLELNSFNATRLGGLVRTSVSGLMVEFAVTRAFTWGSDSTDLLSLTPYRQAARPSHVQFDINAGIPLAEGVNTARFGFIPSTEWVFLFTAGLRYRYFPGSLNGFNAGDVFGALFSPRMGDRELDNLEPQRLPGMRIDRTRYDVVLGFSMDLYFQNGAFIAPRIVLAPPLFSGVTQSGIGLWWELSLALGWTFK